MFYDDGETCRDCGGDAHFGKCAPRPYWRRVTPAEVQRERSAHGLGCDAIRRDERGQRIGVCNAPIAWAREVGDPPRVKVFLCEEHHERFTK